MTDHLLQTMSGEDRLFFLFVPPGANEQAGRIYQEAGEQAKGDKKGTNIHHVGEHASPTAQICKDLLSLRLDDKEATADHRLGNGGGDHKGHCFKGR